VQVSYRFVDIEPGRITTIALNRPERRNAIGRELEAELLGAFRAAEADRGCHVIVLCARGSVFSAGHDIKEGAERQQSDGFDPDEDVGRRTLQEEVWNIRRPVIAAVNGFCGPHATHLVAATDIVLAADDARFSFEHLRITGAHSFPLLTYTIGARRYKEWRLMAKSIDAPTAREWGLVNAVVPADRLLETAYGWAEELARVPLANSIANKLSINKDIERLGIWELWKLRPLFSGATNRSPEQEEYYRSIREQGVGASVRRRDAGEAGPEA
jgi:enoyl-CoA hydratase/carnithine racemase